MITPIVKAAAGLAGVSRQDLAKSLGISAQAMSNKYNRGSFSATDLIKIAAACGYKLSFTDSTGKTVISFPEDTCNLALVDGNGKVITTL